MTTATQTKKTKKTSIPAALPVKEVAFIVDKSGSMDSCKMQVISGFNEYRQDLIAATDLDIRFWLTLFDTEVNHRHHGIPMKDVPEMTTVNYRPGGCTALYDALGQTLNLMERRLAGDKETAITVIVMTDGHENSSREFDQAKIRDQVKRLTDQGNWTFAFMGADQDAWDAAQPLGIPRANTMSYSSKETDVGMASNNANTLRHLRSGKKQSPSFYAPPTAAPAPPAPPPNPFSPRGQKPRA